MKTIDKLTIYDEYKSLDWETPRRSGYVYTIYGGVNRLDFIGFGGDDIPKKYLNKYLAIVRTKYPNAKHWFTGKLI
jgi:hypothetical protein